jgi:hypothetical protein
LSYRTILALVAIVASTVPLAGSAGARDPAAPKLQGTPQTVATATTPDGRAISLVAQDSNEGICLTLKGVTPGAGSCEPPPPVGFGDAGIAQFSFAFQARPAPTTYLFGVVSPATASLQMQLRGGGGQTLATTDGGYTGRYAGKARFYLGAVAGNRPPVYTRALGADGTVLSAAEDQAAVRPFKGPVRVAGGRVGGRRFGISAELKRLLAPAPGQPERRADSLCVRLDRSPAAPVGGSPASFSCDPLHGAGVLDGAYAEYRPGRRCSNSGVFFWGTVGSKAARVSLRLSNHAVISARAIDVRRSLGVSRRVFGLGGTAAGAYPVEFDVLSGAGRQIARFHFERTRIPASRSGCSAVYGAFGEFTGA